MDNQQLLELIREYHALQSKMLDDKILQDGMEDYARLVYVSNILSPIDVIGFLLTQHDKVRDRCIELARKEQIEHGVYS
jgi:hypothetical protein